VRRSLAALAALCLLGAAGCDRGDDGPSGKEKVTTTKVEVVEGLGKEGGFDPGEIYRRLSPGVVTVISTFDGGNPLSEDGGEGGQGSGFVLDGEGYIATNAHVVTASGSNSRAKQVYAEFSTGDRVPARVVGVDPNADVALLKVDPKGLKITPLSLGSSSRLVVGSPVAAIGSPFGERQSLSVGVVSAVDRNIESLTRFQIGDAIQTDAAINPGNSGGPLLDGEGRVIGVNSQIRTEGGDDNSGVGFAVPVDEIKRVVPALERGEEVERAFLGVRMGDAPEGGAAVGAVVAGGPADRGGLRSGDRIVEIDGAPVRDSDGVSSAVNAGRPGQEVRVVVERDGERRTLTVELGTQPDQASGP
jgi:S1-C subfamily serine protease